MISLCLLAMLWALPGFLSQELTVSQPKSKNTTVGGSVVLECAYHISKGDTSIGVYKWYFNESSAGVTEVEVSNSSGRFRERVFMKDPSIFKDQRKADIELRNVRHNDAGTYVCEVEFMLTNGKAHGNGTQLLVLEAPKDGHQGPGTPHYWMALYSAAGVLSLLLAAVVLTLCRRAWKQSRKRKHGRNRNPVEGEQQDHMQYATLSIKQGKRKPRPRNKPEEVVYSKIRTKAEPGDSGSPSEYPDSIVYTRVSVVGNAEAAHRPHEKLAN